MSSWCTMGQVQDDTAHTVRDTIVSDPVKALTRLFFFLQPVCPTKMTLSCDQKIKRLHPSTHTYTWNLVWEIIIYAHIWKWVGLGSLENTADINSIHNIIYNYSTTNFSKWEIVSPDSLSIVWYSSSMKADKLSTATSEYEQLPCPQWKSRLHRVLQWPGAYAFFVMWVVRSLTWHDHRGYVLSCKKRPWAEHLASLPKWGVGTLSSISPWKSAHVMFIVTWYPQSKWLDKQ